MRQTVLRQYFQKKKQATISNQSKQKPIQKQLLQQQLPKVKEQQKEQNKKPQKKVVIEIDEEESVNSDISAKQKKIPTNTNLLFYTNAMKSEPSGDTIDNIHKKWWGNYRLLEEHHGYIQWLFPNLFQSRFNPKSNPLSELEVGQFRKSIQISKRYLNSYMMMLQFYGIKLKSKRTGQLMRSRNPRYLERYQKTLLTAFHNHMRITRILSSLVMVGFGRYAKQLSKFLKSEIYSDLGEMKALRRYGVYERQWKQYLQYEQKQDEMNCFLRQLDKKEPDGKTISK